MEQLAALLHKVPELALFLSIVGGLAGAQTCTPGLNALREATGSNIGALAYTVPTRSATSCPRSGDR